MGSLGTEDLHQVGKPTFPDEANTLEYAKSLDAKDHLRTFRDQFIIPSKSNIKAKKVVKPGLPNYTHFT
jgi:kynureninase